MVTKDFLGVKATFLDKVVCERSDGKRMQLTES